MNYYNRRGEPMTIYAWGEAFEDMEAKRVALDVLPNGYTVSTVWTGIDLGLGTVWPPLIFETMVFAKDQSGDVDMERYSTEAAALAGHTAMVAKWLTQQEATDVPAHS